MHSGVRTRVLAYDGAVASLEHVVFGVHWSPSANGVHAANLDALCVIYDAQDRLLDAVHGGRRRNANDSVVHTGDSRDGANRWDDERIFVFPDALPKSVGRLAFVVLCANRRAFCEVPGATCHVSDPVSEHEWLQINLTALHGHRSHTVAMLRRTRHGWSLAAAGCDHRHEFEGKLSNQSDMVEAEDLALELPTDGQVRWCSDSGSRGLGAAHHARRCP